MHANLGSGSSHAPSTATNERGSFSPSFCFTIPDLIYTKLPEGAVARLLIGYRWIERNHAMAAVEKFSRSDAPFSRYEFLKINSERGCAFDVEFLELADDPANGKITYGAGQEQLNREIHVKIGHAKFGQVSYPKEQSHGSSSGTAG
ncbi:hypothetical protein OUZ56_016257 [Daphnia magna]|uniref:Uncharacterized protein n=1 Tax=Daphnia magna TaxID=35525 RepID=A0ABR0AQ51_9CRUS|nr:hypothetical protein OUZ56_016257 [Daphnia magna]